jgi:PAS domain S-box-containing protein
MAREQDYEWLFRKAPVMVTSIAEDGAYLDVNDAMLGRLGYRLDDMVGRKPEDFATPETADRIANELRPALKRRGRLDNKYVSLVAASGEVVDCITNAFIEYDREGRFLRTVAMYSEIAEEGKANFKYRDLYRSTPAMLHTVDGDGRVITVTDHWLAKLGFRRDEVLGRPITDFMSAADQRKYADGALQTLIAEGGFQNLERQMVTKDGRTIDLVMSAIGHRDPEGNVDRLLVASKDVTERNRAERQLRRTLAENARLREELERERDYLREEVSVALNFGHIVGTSKSLQGMLKRIEAVADTPATVLLLGESGVGKELIASEIHGRSRSYGSIAHPSRKNCSKANSSGTSRARLPGRIVTESGVFSWPTVAHCSSTRSEKYRWSCRESCCAYCRKASSSASVTTSRARSMCASLPRPIVTSRN